MKRATAILLFILITLCACRAGPIQTAPEEDIELERFSVVGFYFDTVITLISYSQDDAAIKQAMDLCGYYEQLLSKTVEGSDVWRINHADGEPVSVSEHTKKLIEASKQASELSGGRFDISIAKVMQLWDFSGEPAFPLESEVKSALEHVGYENIILNGSQLSMKSGAQIDLGAIAKGYIADEIASFLKAEGIEHAILNFGGNVYVIGSKPDNTPFNVGIQDPNGQTGEYLTVVKAIDSSVVTSGIYERGFDYEGVRYHHILDTATGYPVQNELFSVTILSKSSMMGDALSTACLALGLDAGMSLIEGIEDTEAVFITKSGEIIATAGAEERIIIQD